MKSGCKVEDGRLEEAERLKRYRTRFSLIGVRLMHVAYLARVQPDLPASEVFSGAEIQVRYLRVNNARFLILPWIHVKNLASRVLARVSRRLAGDWHARYAYRPVLLETFVEKPRFTGTCYRAANWQDLGDTQGRGKLDTLHRHDKPIKSAWIYPLEKHFRQTLRHP